jgi:hypothetical protein
MMCALAGLAVACGDDSGDNTPAVDAGHDGGGIDAGKTDGGGTGADTGAPTPKVTNAGAACTVATQATACTGSAPICQTMTLGTPSSPIPGGSCSAVCTTDSQCGPGGICPTGVTIAAGGQRAIDLLGPTGYCNKACTKGAATGCGTGFVCVSLNDLSATPMLGIPFLDQTFCYPTPKASGDGGVGDAGTISSVDGGMDAGH